VDFGSGDQLGCDGTGPSRRSVTSSKDNALLLAPLQQETWETQPL